MNVYVGDGATLKAVGSDFKALGLGPLQTVSTMEKAFTRYNNNYYYYCAYSIQEVSVKKRKGWEEKEVGRGNF